MAKKKLSLLEIVAPLSLAFAILSLFVTIFLILTNPSQFPMIKNEQQLSTTNQQGFNEILSLAKQDLAKRLNIKETKIVMVRIERKRWSDTSLGCPQTGMMYAQVITPGYQVILQAEEKTYDFHTDLQGRIVLCNQTVITPTGNQLQ